MDINMLMQLKIKKNFLKRMSELESYLFEFDLEKNIKDKIYPNNY